MLHLSCEDARKAAAEQALQDLDVELASSIRNFQLRNIRPKAASEIADLTQASKLPGRSDKRIAETVYRRVGEVVNPTR